MWFKKLTALIFALYPILWIYKSPLPFVYGGLLLMLLAIVGFFRKDFTAKGHKAFLVLWGYLAITNVLISIGYLSITTFVPGGITFFVFAFTYLFLCGALDYSLYKKYYKAIALICVLFWSFQEVMYFSTGTRVAGLIPFMDITGELTTSELIAKLRYIERSASFFREPAHFFQFLTPILCIDLFDEKNRGKLSPFSIILIACMLLSRSGNAMIGLAVVLTSKGVFWLKQKGSNWALLLVLIPIAYFAISFYIESEMGGAMLERADEFDNENASGYLRVVRGFLVYSAMPLTNQLIGINSEVLESMLPNLGVLFLTGDADSDMYFNGFQNILIHDGLLGMLFYIMFYISIYKRTTPTGKSLIWLTLALSLISNIYLTYCMLICMVVSTVEIKNNKIYEKNSILHQKGIS